MQVHIPADFTIAELKRFLDGDDAEVLEGYYTAQEWADFMQVNIRTMRVLLNRAKERGLLDKKLVPRVALDDKTIRVPAYALKKPVAEDKE